MVKYAGIFASSSKPASYATSPCHSKEASTEDAVEKESGSGQECSVDQG